MKRMLLVFAHPDDESFTCGGTIAKYTHNGWEVHLLCVTRGEAGNRGTYRDIDDDSLGAIREKELQNACKLLGIRSIKFLDYKDGTLSGVEPGEIEHKVYKTMTDLAPSVVITFEPQGITNHPDHIKLTRATTVAFQKFVNVITYVREKLISEKNPPRHPRDFWQIEFARKFSDNTLPKLYFVCEPESIVDYFIHKKKVYPALSFGKPWSSVPDKMITTAINIGAYQRKKVDALRVHATQAADVEPFLSVVPNPLLKQEFFVLRMQGSQEVFMGKNDRVSDRL